MLVQLPTIKENLQKIKSLAKQIKLTIYSLETKPNSSMHLPINKDFTLCFHADSHADIYVLNQRIYIPTMSLEKLQGLDNFFKLIDCPYVFEHEACHLLDNQWLLEYTPTYEVSHQMLEDRADAVEVLLSKD